MTEVLTWPAAFEAGAAVCGGKGWNLARLYRYGFSVPAGGVLSAEVYRRLIVEESIARQIIHIDSINAESLSHETSLQALAQLQNSIKACHLSDATRVSINEFLLQQGLQESALAIRSSATLEDSETASFAGVYDSYLNVQGEAKIELAVLACYASLWSLRAVAYRRKMNIGNAGVAAAIVINQLLNAETSGVAFSCDPVSGRTDICFVNANYGLGESVVSGAAEPDQFKAHIHRKKIVSRQLGSKNKKSVLVTTGGTCLRAVNGLNEQACLSDEQVLQLNRLSQRVFVTLGQGEEQQDIEWLHDGEQFWLLQARHVTALPTYTVPGLQGEKQVWSNGNFRDAIPMVLPPMLRSFAQFHIDNIMSQSYKGTAYMLPEGLSFSKYFQGRFYCNASLVQWCWYDAAGLEPRMTNLNLGGHQQELAFDYRCDDTLWKKLKRFVGVLRFLKNINDTKKRAPEIFTDVKRYVDNVMARDFSKLTDPALLDLYCQVDDRITAYDESFIILSSASGAATMLIQLLEKKLGEEAIPVANALLAGEGDITSAAHGYALYEMAELVEEEEVARAWFESNDYENGQWQSLPDDSAFKQAFKKFLDEYGHRAVYEIDFSRPRWHEDQRYLLDVIKNAMGCSMLANIKARQKQHAQNAWNKVEQHFNRLMRAQIRSTAKRAAEGAAVKEQSKSFYIHYLRPLRALSLEMGRRLSARGLLENVEDIFYCTWPEVEAIVAQEWSGKELVLLVAERKALQQQQEQHAAADVIVDDSPTTVAPTRQSTGGLKGIAVAAGRARGTACVVYTPEQGVQLQHGGVLVAPSTDPAWTPLFLNAAALVMETGGYLSHGSIVAREYGIPAVVNVPGIMQAINNGDALSVNGDQGLVEVLQ